MTAVWFFLGFLVLIGLVLIVAGDRQEQQRKRYAQLVQDNHELRSTLTAVEHEARAQLQAGDPNFDYLLTLINPHLRELS
jgi:hypothetical protein